MTESPAPTFKLDISLEKGKEGVVGPQVYAGTPADRTRAPSAHHAPLRQSTP